VPPRNPGVWRWPDAGDFRFGKIRLARQGALIQFDCLVQLTGLVMAARLGVEFGCFKPPPQCERYRLDRRAGKSSPRSGLHQDERGSGLVVRR
jgi:hypothetical protein